MIAIKEGSGNRRVYIKIDRIDEDMRSGIRKGFFKLGISLRKTSSKQILAKNKRGRLYRIRRGKRIVRHRASAPGQSPANITGKYRRSFGFQIRGSEKMDFGARDKKAGWLEDGTDKMEPRPGVGNAVKEENKNAMNYFQVEIDKSVKL